WISHVAKVLDRLWGRGQVGKGGEQRHDRHETRRSPIRNLSSHRAPLSCAWPARFLVPRRSAWRRSILVRSRAHARARTQRSVFLMSAGIVGVTCSLITHFGTAA